MNVIFHLNDTSRFNHCYSNINNIVKESEIEEIRVLMNGDSVQLAVEGVEEKIKELIDLGAVVCVCQNSLNANNIDSSDLVEGLEVVRTGVFELMKRQEQGYSYIKV